VELHGGRLRFRSRVGSGSVVVLSLQRQPITAGQDTLESEAA
jgi:signal transduction histidine kinase